MPAEWEKHAATWIGWPHHRPDWPGKFEPIKWVYAEIVRVLHQHERVEVLCDDESVKEEARTALLAHGVNLEHVRLHVVGTDRVWLRDSAPTAVMAPNGTVHWVSWRFNAWAKYENFTRDELIGFSIGELSGMDREEAQRPDGNGRLVLEGGGIEANGAGALLVTEEWLLSDVQTRNPGMRRADYERAFDHYLGITHTIWLGEGCVGDDTHGQWTTSRALPMRERSCSRWRKIPPMTITSGRWTMCDASSWPRIPGPADSASCGFPFLVP
jgi:Peptidylarginine deiminase and related enzymes